MATTDASDDDVAQIAAALARDFDGTCLLLANELATSSDPALVLEIVCAIASSEPARDASDSDSESEYGDNSLEAVPWRLSDDVLERFLTEFVPQAVQLVLATQTYAQACAPRVNRFLQVVLTQAKAKLVTGDPCLLPSLLRILDEQRPFYCSRSMVTEQDTDKDAPVASAFIQAPAPHVSPWFAANVAFWAELGGFALFLSSLRSLVRDADGHIVDTVLSFEAAQCIVRALYGVAEHLAPLFLASYVRPFCDALRCFVTTVAAAEFHAVPREALVEVAQVTELVLMRVLELPSTSDDAVPHTARDDEPSTNEFRQSVQLLQLAIFGRQLQSPSLEKRINGLSDIVALVTREFNAQVETQAQPTAASLIQKLAHMVAWLEQSAVLDDIFGETRHAELIKRALPLFQFASELEHLDVRWLDRVWTCYCGSGSASHQRHEDHRAVAYDLLLDLIDCLDAPMLRVLLRKLQDIRAVDASDLALLTAIAARSSVWDAADDSGDPSCETQQHQYQQQRLRDVVLTHLWTVVLPSAASDAAIDDVLDHIEMIIKRAARDNDDDDDRARDAAQDTAMVTRFLQASLNAIASGEVTHVALTGFTRLALLVTELQWRVPALMTQDHRSAVDVVLAALLDVPTTDGVSRPIDAVHARLLALRAAWIFETHRRGSASVLSRTQLDAIWDRLVDAPDALDATSSLCFAWLSCCMNTSVAHSGDDTTTAPLPLLSDDLVEHLVVHKFVSLGAARMTHTALTCFQRLFEHLNLRQHGLALATSAGAADESESQHRCLATGAPLVGLTQLWRLAVSAPTADVAADCITFLASLYLELTPDAAHEASDDVRTHKKLEFVDTCMRLLDDAKALSTLERHEASGDVPSECIATVNRCIDLLRYFLDACDAAAGIDAESELLSRQRDTLRSSGAAPPRGRKSWELENLEERLPHLEIFPSPMKDAHVVATGAAAASEQVPLRRPSWSFRQHHAMLDVIPDDDDGDESSDSSDAPGGAPQDMPMAWTHSASTTMAVAIEASLPLPARTVITSPTLRVRPTLQWPQDVSPPRGPDLSTDDLSQALHDASAELPPPASDDHNTMPLPATVAAGEAVSPVASKYSVASHVLANRDAYFDTLFQLVDWPETTSQRTWELLCRLPTNNALLRKMIRLRPLGSSSAVVWTDQLDTANTHRLLYALRLVEALLLPLDAAHARADDPTADAARRQWRERFVRLGGAYHLYETLLSWNSDQASGADGATASVYAINLRATCLAALVRTLAYVLRLANRRSGENGAGAVACAFGTRLFESSLPAFIEAIELSVVRDHAMRLSMANALGSGRLALSSQEEEAIQSSVQLFAATGALDPRVLVWQPSDSESTLQQQEPQCGLADWLDCLLVQCRSTVARTATLAALTDLLAETTVVGSASASAFVERLVCGLSTLVIGVSDASVDVSQLFALLESVLRVSVPRLEQQSQEAVVSWLKTHAVAQRLLVRLSVIVTRPVEADRSAAPGVDERVVCSYVRVVRALVRLSDALREQALHCHPLGTGDADGDRSASREPVQWTLDLVLTHLLFGDVCASNASDDAATATAAVVVLPVCTSTKSRALASALLVSLLSPSSREPPSIANLVEPTQTALAHVLTHHVAFQTSVLETLRQRGRPWRFAPREFLRGVAGGIAHAGLVNPGCVCYMNALLQQLFLTPRFRDGLLATDCSDESAEWADEVAQLQQLFVALAYSTRKALDPTAFALSHRDLDGEPTDVRVQMDADEFFCLLLDRLDTNLRRSREPQDDQTRDTKTPPATFLDDVFGGVLVHQVTTEHGDVSERDEKFFALSLDVSSQPTLTDSLAQYVQGEALDGANAYYCERLERKVAATKRVCLKTLPQTLVCHLKRFAFDFDTMEKRKVHDALAFPHELDLLPFTRDGLSGAAGDTEPIMYDLVGVVVHSGSADMGHYYSFIKDREAPPLTTHQWLEFNDDTVRSFDVADLGPECFGGEEVKQFWDGHARVRHVQMKRRSAYMLVYERRSDTASVTTETMRSTTLAAVHPTLSALVKQTQVENAQFQRVVDAFDPTYSAFVASLVRQTLALPSFPVASSGGFDAEAVKPRGWTSHVQAAVLGCQFLFGMVSLRASASEDNAAFAAQETALLSQILDWVSATTTMPAAIDDSNGPETDSTTTDTVEGEDADRCAFSKWLLRESIASPASPATAPVARSWVFDLVFLSEHNPELVNGGLALLAAAISVLTRHTAATDSDSASASRAVLQDFYRTLFDLFYDREHESLEVLDPATGGAVTLSSHATTNALVRIGALLERCVCVMFADAPDARALTLATLGHSLQFVDRLVFTLQTELTDTSGPTSAGPFAAATLSPSDVPRIRSCTLESERRILAELLPLVCADDASVSNTGVCGMEVDASLVLSQTALTNIVRCGLDQTLAPVFLCIAQSGSAMQREKLLSLLMAVLEDLKMTHVRPILRLVEQLLDAEERDVAGLDTSQAVASARIHRHVFSASRGLLEAAAYYRDHETLHSYAYALLRFCIMRGRSSQLLQHVFASSGDGNDALCDQVAWVPDWLTSYVDPSGDIRRQRASATAAAAMELRSDDEEEDAKTAADAIELLDAVALMFTCAVDSAAPEAEEHETQEMNQQESGDSAGLTLDDIVAEIVESHDPKQRKGLEPSDATKERGPEVDDTDDGDDEANNSHGAVWRDKGVAHTRPAVHVQHRVEPASSMRDRMYYNRSEA